MFIGVDIGTSGSKALLMREDGTILAEHTGEYSIDAPFPGWAEQRPDMWLASAASCIRALDAASFGEVKGIAFSGQMHGIVLVDEKGEAIRPAILWADCRTAREIDFVNKRIGERRFADITRNRLAAGFGLASLVWLRKHEPQTLEKAARVLCPKDYVRGKLTGNFGQETSDASSTCCLDVSREDWAWEIIDALDLPRRIFGPVAHSTDPAGVLTRDGARLCGLPESTPVYYGGGDSSMAGIGAGVVAEGILGVNIGTGGQVSTILNQPKSDADHRLSTFCHPIRNHWILQGSTLCAGLALKWFRDRFCPGTEFAELSRAAAKVRCGANGLYFLPYLTGERTPWYDPGARGILAGLSLSHGIPEVARAIMEGVALALEQSYSILRETGIDCEKILAMGGGAKSPTWLQIQADIFGLPVHPVMSSDACVGAAIVAGVGCGAYKSIREGCGLALKESGVAYSPDTKNHEAYAAMKQKFRNLYLDNVGVFV